MSKWRKKKVLMEAPISASTLWRLVKAGNFPTPMLLTESTPVWESEEVESWLASRPRQTAENVRVVAEGCQTRGRKPKAA